ncbi:MAG TPA: aldo/keto reductase [Spirochaetia bacterium]|nr:aldo/keto reductase [Spirochaetia bacterium]
MIAQQVFGRTGHKSTRIIFGSAGLKRLTQKEADPVLDLLLQYGINHIDTAPGYGDAELRLGPWMREHRKRFFLATKIDEARYGQAKEQLHRSLERLQVDSVDLLQLHNLTDVPKREQVMGSGGALELLIEAKEQGLTRFLGVTGHGITAPKMHLQSLQRFDFDSVLLPCNYLLLRSPAYSADFSRLLSYCREHNVAVQTIKSIARGLWGEKEQTRATWYEPLTDQEAVSNCVHYVLGIPGIFLISVGDMQELPKVLKAAADYQNPPLDEEMERIAERFGMEPLFT